MSVKIMSRVWEGSKQKGSALLLLLAIADNADDTGYCWPGIDYLARKIRMTKQSVVNITKQLEESGELYTHHSRRAGNKYLVVVGMDEAEFMESMLKFGYDEDTYFAISKKFLIKACFTSEVKSFDFRSKTAILQEPSIPQNESSNTMGLEEFDEMFPRKFADIDSEDTINYADKAERDNAVIEATRKHAARSASEPWLYCGDWLKPRNGTPKSDLQHVLWLVVTVAGIPEPNSDELRKRWPRHLESMYKEAGGNWETLRRAMCSVKDTEAKYRGDISKWAQKFVMAERENNKVAAWEAR